MNRKPLSNQEFTALRDYIYRKAGIFFTESGNTVTDCMALEEIAG